MINLKKDFECMRDANGWQLNHYYNGFDKNKNPKRSFNKSYYANFGQVIRAVIDIEAGKCESMEELLSLLKKAYSGAIITEKVKGAEND
jgi:hypothetical protein